MISVLAGVTISVFMLIGIGLASDLQIYAQNENQTSEAVEENMSDATAPQAKIHQETPGEKTFYVFTSEVENVDETKLGVAGDSFSDTTHS
jgi:hypothetical protein